MPQLALRAPYRIVLAVSACPPLAAPGISQKSGAAQGLLASRINPEPGACIFNHPKEYLSMTFSHCPNCQSDRIGTRNTGRKAGGAIGTVAGAASGAAGALGGAEIGGTVGAVAGPAGALLGAFAGAILGGLFGGAAGGAVGASLGETVDANILDNYRCLACGHCFSVKPP
jgi:phage tail tape-measure protein